MPKKKRPSVKGSRQGNPHSTPTHKREYFYNLAKKEGYRARSAYKLQQIDHKYHLFTHSRCVVEFCCAPGSWLQYSHRILSKLAISRDNKDFFILGVDRVTVPSIPGVSLLEADILDDAVVSSISNIVPVKPDVVLSDCSPHTTGNTYWDRRHQLPLVERALELARLLLVEGGNFVGKAFKGRQLGVLKREMRDMFEDVFDYKPRASKKTSDEIYLIGLKRL